MGFRMDFVLVSAARTSGLKTANVDFSTIKVGSMSRRMPCTFLVDPNALYGAARIISDCELCSAAGVRPDTRARRAEKRAFSASPAGGRPIWPRRDLRTFQQ